jgi:hypothetical protein
MAIFMLVSAESGRAEFLLVKQGWSQTGSSGYAGACAKLIVGLIAWRVKTTPSAAPPRAPKPGNVPRPLPHLSENSIENLFVPVFPFSENVIDNIAGFYRSCYLLL